MFRYQVRYVFREVLRCSWELTKVVESDVAIDSKEIASRLGIDENAIVNIELIK